MPREYSTGDNKIEFLFMIYPYGTSVYRCYCKSPRAMMQLSKGRHIEEEKKKKDSLKFNYLYHKTMAHHHHHQDTN